MIETAVILAAGEGSRLRASAPYKPLCPVAGRPLIAHALEGLAEAGLKRAIVTLSYGRDAIEAYLASRSWPLHVETVLADHREPNGVSVLAATDALAGEDAILAMCDHLVLPALYRRMATAGSGNGLRLGIDRRLGHPWVDPEDVTCVATNGSAIVAIGKGLEPHDAYDTGVFAISPRLGAALATLASPSLTEGVRMLVAENGADVVDCSDIDWIDVDDAAALAHAERWMSQAA
ncbi:MULTISPECIES: NTP transferase domain-containing protein [Sphingomonas]|uniref:phosphocholine cytidylyltransferase family protein n=1 Tax=Sphingomonas TaxID=13687 RepID=UPI0006FB19B1|nr:MULTISPECIES: NTP transferase domain-containing protein [Sphingomonas]KQM94796.1 nucleotidyltransferase [Sphingomonas sp. Leaf226]MDY0968179.1 NTP transferase domain-containing protein [Sphingomonas sp. CFBP9021]USR01335.1 NTP transferase domain-containing protein [Sphingomonas aerolata]